MAGLAGWPMGKKEKKADLVFGTLAAMLQRIAQGFRGRPDCGTWITVVFSRDYLQGEHKGSNHLDLALTSVGQFKTGMERTLKSLA